MEGMPSKSTVMRWLSDEANEDFRDQYARARERQADHFADEILEIADDGHNDWMDRQVRKGVFVRSPDHEHINRSKLRVDARKWLMSKLAPKKYGEKLELTGAEGGPVRAIISAEPLTEKEWDAKYGAAGEGSMEPAAGTPESSS